jgi:hypothetical protein
MFDEGHQRRGFEVRKFDFHVTLERLASRIDQLAGACAAASKLFRTVADLTAAEAGAPTCLPYR